MSPGARDEILAEIARYEHGLHARDVEAVMDAFAADAVSFDLAPPLETRADAEKDRAANADGRRW